MWVRGLKPMCSCVHLYKKRVAPYVGAWIETPKRVHCTRRREESHPMWVRGLKQRRRNEVELYFVAPYVGAWIETSRTNGASRCSLSHPMWVRGLKHQEPTERVDAVVAPYVGAWIETLTQKSWANPI